MIEYRSKEFFTIDIINSVMEPDILGLLDYKLFTNKDYPRFSNQSDK